MTSLLPVALCIVLTLTLSGCNREQETAPAQKPAATGAPQPPEPATTTLLLHEPLEVQRGETFSDTLPVWRRFAAQKPTLLLLANNPALIAPPAALSGELDQHLAMADDYQLRLAGDPQRSDPLYLPAMSVDIALRQGWLGGLAWAIPLRGDQQQINLETFREKLQSSHLASAEEAATLHLDNNIVAGALRTAPFRAGTLFSLPPLEGPLLVHIDLSYFQDLYKNEIATPAIALVGSTLQQLAERNLQVFAVTFSYSHAESGIPLNVRFIGDFITELTKNPQQLKQPLQPVWKLQSDILYLENFFQKDEIRRLVEQQSNLAPKAAFAAYNRYYTATLFKKGNEALAEIAKTVAIDPVYANEYLVLSERAYNAKRPDQALRMLKLASEAQPVNVQLQLQIVRLAADIGDKEEVQRQVDALKKKNWSPVYYADMTTYLEQLE